ncbi:hypothetical protein H0A66_12775 [Alcaligenaceae bacterium]|nr:hypothetical protein [Alcaligenaceae bacterium]
MLPSPSIPIREPCPAGACICNRDTLLNKPDSDTRILCLTKHEEKKLIARIERISSYDDLTHVADLMQRQLGIAVQISPGINEVRSMRGFNIVLIERPGLCSKTRQTVPAAIRRCLEKNPEIAFTILNNHDLLGG